MKQLIYKERKCRMHGDVIDVFIGDGKRGEIRKVLGGYRYRVTRCNFGPIYESVERVKQFILFKNPSFANQESLF